MLGISRWTERDGSYRTIQRLFQTAIPWTQVFWTFFVAYLFDRQDTYLLAGDESVITKAGKETHGLDYFFSGLLQKVVPGLSFFTLAVISVRQRRSFPLQIEQTLRTKEEKAASLAKKKVTHGKADSEKRKVGRPKGSRNKDKAEVELTPELKRIQQMVQNQLKTIQGRLSITYLVLNGHFGNHPAWHMVRQCQLHRISKLRYDAALFFPLCWSETETRANTQVG